MTVCTGENRTCPAVPIPYPGTAGQPPAGETTPGTQGGTESLKSLAAIVLQRAKAGQARGHKPGQDPRACPTPVQEAGQKKGLARGGAATIGTDPETVAVCVGDRNIRVTIFHGQPSPEAVDLADQMLTFLADRGAPVDEDSILAATTGDTDTTRDILYHLAVEGMVEFVGGGRFKIPAWPPEPADLPERCPLRGGSVPTECRFETGFFRRLLEEGVLPLPGGRCPLRQVCKLGH